MDISTEFAKVQFENPFVLASAPPTGDEEKIRRAFDEGWSGAVIKTLMHEPARNLTNRFAVRKTGRLVNGFFNLEQVSEKKTEEWLNIIRRLKEDYPEKRIIGSMMGEAERYDNWKNLALACQQAGVDLLELNFSCPNGYPDKGKGAAIGQNPQICGQIVSWMKNDPQIHLPVIPKLTAAITDITQTGQAVADAGADGICAINTIPSFMGFDLKTLKPKPNIGGHATYGGYSGAGIKPIALKSVSALLKCPGIPVMGSGGISNGFDAVEFLLLGAPVVQIATAVMLYGFKLIKALKTQLIEFMEWHQFTKLDDFLGMGNEMICSYESLDMGFNVKAVVNEKHCIGCKICEISCQDAGYGAITMQDKLAVIDSEKCVGCSLCYNVCPYHAIEMLEVNQ